MNIDLKRTFSPADKLVEEEQLWELYQGRTTVKLTWNDLHEKLVTVVVGEAGIGKTIELQQEVSRLQEDGKAAFFVALDSLQSPGDWDLYLGQDRAIYDDWIVSQGEGFFFFDSVDEARLKGHKDFEKAVLIASSCLNPYFKRVRVVVSSRWADWSLPEVQATVLKLLVKPIYAQQNEEPKALEVGPFVVSLNPLSKKDAKRFMSEKGVTDVEACWEAVVDGSYEFIATRPLDLEWLISVWINSETKTFGNYLSLLEGNVINRLKEYNIKYLAAELTVSLDRLRAGVELLAACAEFSGRHYIAVDIRHTPRTDELAPYEVLSGWDPKDIKLLLDTAIFDKASFGRIKFHHRSAREYLAACWVKRQKLNGVQFHQIISLFSDSPFGYKVLISSRRWCLCWLAAIDVEVREWVTKYFPEIFIFDGDPEAWDQLSAEQAFIAYLSRVAGGLRTEWMNSPSELRRVARRLRPGLIASILSDPNQPDQVRSNLLPYVKFAELCDCAEVVFDMYKNQSTSDRQRLYALEVLETIATSKQRAEIRKDLLDRRLRTDDLIAAALSVITWKELTVEQLTGVLLLVKSEDLYTSSSTAYTIKNDFLPSCSEEAVELLLKAIFRTISQVEESKPKTSGNNKKSDRSWLTTVLLDSYLRFLDLLPHDLKDFQNVCLDAAVCIEAMCSRGDLNREKISAIVSEIAKRPNLYWAIALKIALSGEVRAAVSRMTWRSHCIVSFQIEDLPEITRRANEFGSTKKEWQVWFEIAIKLVMNRLKGRMRADALRRLMIGPDENSRRVEILSLRLVLAQDLCSLRKTKVEDRIKKQKREEKRQSEKAEVLDSIERIKDGVMKGALSHLLTYSNEHSANREWCHVDRGLIESDFGKNIVEALTIGLEYIFNTTDVPAPVHYLDGHRPETVCYLEACFNMWLEKGIDFSSLSPETLIRATKLEVWNTSGPSTWFEEFAKGHGSLVCDALTQWLCDEVSIIKDDTNFLRTVDLVLKCSSDIRKILLEPIVQIVLNGRVVNIEILRRTTEALREDELLDVNTTSRICKAQVMKSVGGDGLIGDMRWMKTWFRHDISLAWEWFERHLHSVGDHAWSQLEHFAKVIDQIDWVRLDGNPRTVDSLVKLFEYLNSPPLAKADLNDEVKPKSDFWEPVPRIRDSIPEILSRMPGAVVNQALGKLAKNYPEKSSWLIARQIKQAEEVAQKHSIVDPSQLGALYTVFQATPNSESQLYNQVVSRLEEIRKGLEEGPFSERDLFKVNMPEKHLQRWLAAKLRDTQSRRFNVHREEEVDNDKKSDIQLSCPHGNVCVEIKPVDRKRTYTALTLKDTLRTQMVGQYLKGFNSRHGILVLFRLDDKTWSIPGGRKRQPFSALVDYLQKEAEIIRAESGNVGALLVVGFDCIICKSK